MKKYPDVNDFIAIRNMTYFDDAEQIPMPLMRNATSWETMKKYINEQVKVFCNHL